MSQGQKCMCDIVLEISQLKKSPNPSFKVAERIIPGDYPSVSSTVTAEEMGSSEQ